MKQTLNRHWTADCVYGDQSSIQFFLLHVSGSSKIPTLLPTLELEMATCTNSKLRKFKQVGSQKRLFTLPLLFVKAIPELLITREAKSCLEVTHTKATKAEFVITEGLLDQFNHTLKEEGMGTISVGTFESSVVLV